MIEIKQLAKKFKVENPKKLSEQEQKALEYQLLHTSFDAKSAPVQINGSLSYVEQQHWI